MAKLQSEYDFLKVITWRLPDFLVDEVRNASEVLATLVELGRVAKIIGDGYAAH